MISFRDRIVLITGASRGVGAAAAVQFAAAGAKGVIINYHVNWEAAAKTAAEVERHGAEAVIVQADVSVAEQAHYLVRQAVDRYNRLDVVVANAGVWPASDAPVTELPDEQWEDTMRINLNGVYYVCREGARVMVSGGSIVTVSSTAGQRGEAGHSDYAASKGAVISFTKSLATELGPRNVRVNCVAPGWIDTDMAADALRHDEQSLRRITEAIPLRRVATADDVAGPILFLASDLARHVTGEILNINGGSVLCG
ncbi:MAG: SDR family oxidoreductase [Acidobacteriota bacterium]|nr:MAG: SDR family oxidoreductase [Acidobacteriota bacterium]